MCLPLVEAHHRDGFMGKILSQQPQLRFAAIPIVKRGLHRRGDVAGIGTPGEVNEIVGEPPGDVCNTEVGQSNWDNVIAK